MIMTKLCGSLATATIMFVCLAIWPAWGQQHNMTPALRGLLAGMPDPPGRALGLRQGRRSLQDPAFRPVGGLEGPDEVLP